MTWAGLREGLEQYWWKHSGVFFIQKKMLATLGSMSVFCDCTTQWQKPATHLSAWCSGLSKRPSTTKTILLLLMLLWCMGRFQSKYLLSHLANIWQLSEELILWPRCPEALPNSVSYVPIFLSYPPLRGSSACGLSKIYRNISHLIEPLAGCFLVSIYYL